MTNVVKLHDDADTIRRIEKYIEQPPENSRVFTITPVVAEHLLNVYNKNNRPRRPTAVTDYSSCMAGDEWFLTGDTIKFSDANKMRDGQHRLMACVRSGKSFRTHIVFGIDDYCFAALDRGKNRGGADVLAIAGHSNTTKMAAAIRWAYLVDEGRAKQRDVISPDFTYKLASQRFTSISNFIAPASAVARLTGQPIGMVAGLLYLFDRKNSELATEFATGLAAGQFGGRFAPLGRLQKKIGELSSQSSGRVHDVVRAALIIIAWNAFVHRRSGNATEFGWKLVDDFPKIEG